MWLYVVLDQPNNVDELREPVAPHLEEPVVGLLPFHGQLVLQDLDQVPDRINGGVHPYLHQFVALPGRIHQEDHDWNAVVLSLHDQKPIEAQRGLEVRKYFHRLVLGHPNAGTVGTCSGFAVCVVARCCLGGTAFRRSVGQVVGLFPRLLEGFGIEDLSRDGVGQRTLVGSGPPADSAEIRHVSGQGHRGGHVDAAWSARRIGSAGPGDALLFVSVDDWSGAIVIGVVAGSLGFAGDFRIGTIAFQ